MLLFSMQHMSVTLIRAAYTQRGLSLCSPIDRAGADIK
jgi:hypothetical protein